MVGEAGGGRGGEGGRSQRMGCRSKKVCCKAAHYDNYGKQPMVDVCLHSLRTVLTGIRTITVNRKRKRERDVFLYLRYCSVIDV